MFPGYRQRTTRRLAILLLFALLLAGSAPAAAQEGPRGAEFTDVKGHWAEEFILTLLYGGVLNVPEDGRFRPEEPVNRYDFTVWLARSLELQPVTPERPPFKDWVQIPEEGRGLIAAAVEKGLIGGYPDGTFRPKRTINRAEMALIFGRVLIPLGVTVEDRYLYLFDDRDRIPAWAHDGLAAVKARIILGRPSGGKRLFAPTAQTTRAETATILVRFLEVYQELTGLPTLKPPTVQPAPGHIMAAYYDNRDVAHASLLANGRHVDWLIYAAHVIKADGSLLGYNSPRTLTWASQSGKPLLVMYGNHDRSVNHALLTNPEAQAKAIENIRSFLRERGYAGINLDMEDIPWEDRPLLTEFVRRLSEALRADGKLVTMAVPAKTRDDPKHGWSGAFDYAALGRLVDYVVIMTYDEHYPSSAPGPIGSLPWMESVLKYAVSVIPPGKILVGIPGYAYDWPQGGRARAIYASAAPDLAARYGATPVYKPTLGESTFNYVDDAGRKRTVWYTPPEGVEAKLQLVARYGLAGAALWQMGYEPPEFWQVVERVLR